MFYRTKTNSKGKIRYEVVEKYKDPLTGKWKTAIISYYKNSSRARKQAELELIEKIETLQEKTKSSFSASEIKTFGELKESWFNSWSVSVKKQTIEREKLVLSRLGKIIGDDYLIDCITPLLLKNCLSEYLKKYDSSAATMTHIKSSLNRIFNYAVMYGIIQFSPLAPVRLEIPLEKKLEVKRRHDAKCLDIHEIIPFFEVLSQVRNQSYYDLGIVLLFTGLRIGEAAFTSDDVNFETQILDVNKSLQTHDLKVDDFYFDSTKTANSERKILLPKIACEAIKRAIKRNNEFDLYAKKNPSPNFRYSPCIFRTEYGSPIRSSSFREVLKRVEEKLLECCEEQFGFKWTKHVTPHSFRHMHITYLQSGSKSVNLKEIMARVGHSRAETTLGYTHQTIVSQEESLKALDEFAQKCNIDFSTHQFFTSKHSKMASEMIETSKAEKIVLTVQEFREKLHLSNSYQPRHISANILPKIKKELTKVYPNFEVLPIKKKGKVLAYEMSW
ncbi:tyrosine-type recombinase/integrase [Streptococcus suis]|uniref:tyrosine-type recombinase/integrase n=1 Tax=Streptococcus suis TaxID=1307 RepID=UPI00042905C2|nr:site-specific integrase [Streptococcus suis 10581]